MALRQTHFLFTLLTFLIGIVGGVAQAKEVTLNWEVVEGSTRYELEIESSAAGPTKMIRAEKSEWRGDLPFGVYSYRVRAIDRVKRPGSWTEKRPLVVVPAAPRLIQPKDGEKISVLRANDPKILKWEKLAGTEAYKLQIFRDGAPVFSKEIQGTEANLAELSPGNYTWSIQAVIRAPRRALASLQNRTWNGKESDASSFKIEYRELEAPKTLFPSGEIFADRANLIYFKWKTVPEAKAYEITLERNDSDDGEKIKRIVFKTTKSSIAARVKDLGYYRWKVRALASVAPHEGASSESSGSFDLVPSGQSPGKGYASFSGMFAPYQYEIQTQTGKGNLASEAFTYRLAGETWVSRKWGVGVGLQNTNLKIDGLNYVLGDYEIFAKYRLSVGKSSAGWLLLPKAGIELRDYIFLSPFDNVGGALSERKIQTLGLALGFDLRKQLSLRWSVGLKVTYFKPIHFSGAEGGTITGVSSTRNLSAGLQGFYWLTRSWGLGMGGFMDRRSFSYTAPAKGAESVNMDAIHLFGSLLFLY